MYVFIYFTKISFYLYLFDIVLSYARVYTNVTTAEGYQQLFADLFNVVKNLTGRPLNLNI